MIYVSGLYVTTDDLRGRGGGSLVARNEYQALQEYFASSMQQCYVWDRATMLESGEVPSRPLPEPREPFMFDYLLLSKAQQTRAKIAHFYGNPFKYAAEALRRNGAKIVVTCPAHSIEESSSEFTRCGLTYDYPHLTRPLLWRLYTDHIKYADKVILPSEKSRQYLVQRFGANDSMWDRDNVFTVIPHGCDLPVNVAPMPSEIRFGYTGQIGPDKGIRYLIEAWSRLDNVADSVLLLGGQPPENYRPYLEAYRVSHKGSFHLTGFVPDISDFYNDCTAYIQPSVSEGFGLEVVEAMSHARPVIVSTGAGASELVEEGVNGLKVAPRDVDGLMAAIRRLHDNPREAEEMGRRARLKALDYAWPKIRERYRQVYGELLKGVE